ncbi:hypothetical protein GCM10009764_65290 [Nocardia ninae]|uniref:Uncharacterized protein n=1 Tax=Nocardia ninae NBRC 108245 TaxID=1210091 RepID=A0A511MH60_9NOCA|nr:hypothetical protein NN4_45420 [Nocardia ninae NBRC 108245]
MIIVGTTKPFSENGEVFVVETAGGLDVVEQGWAGVVVGYPFAVGVGVLVIDPDEGAASGPGDQGSGFPVESEPSVFVLVVVG